MTRFAIKSPLGHYAGTDERITDKLHRARLWHKKAMAARAIQHNTRSGWKVVAVELKEVDSAG